MAYLVNEIFYTLQGEGYWSGRPAVFCRFSRCNLWTGREEDRSTAVCQFCDTDFLEANLRFETAKELSDAIKQLWRGGGKPMVVFTGGEPMLQLKHDLLMYLDNWYCAVETNGTIDAPILDELDWVCVSPKVNAKLAVHRGDELKLVYPQGPDPSVYLGLGFNVFWLSPMDGPDLTKNTAAAVEYVLAHPEWRLNTQTHKQIGVR